MDKITLKNNLHNTATILPNEFIDKYMLKADGEYVKIYLLILRLTNSNIPVDIEQLADTLELTRKDILRALNYWKKVGLLSWGDVETGDSFSGETNSRSLSTSTMNTGTVSPQGEESVPVVPEKNSRSMTDMTKSISGTDLEQTIYMAETYLGRPLSVSELNSFCYISDSLGFSSELLEYLIEYCITRGKKSVRYMETVAINWFQQKIDTVKKARAESSQYTQNVFPVMKAFGLASRNPGPAELDYIQKWNLLGFDTDIIIEACNRTLLATHQASFPYANRILTDWKKNGVRSLSDVQSLDHQFHSSATQPEPEKLNRQPAGKNTANSFHNFQQRDYDYDALESRLLEKNRR